MADEYHDWLREAWKEVCEDFCKGIFKPSNEKDITDHLYRKMKMREKEDSDVMPEFGIADAKIDLQIITYEKDKLIPCLPIEVKETHYPTRTAFQVIKKIKDDVSKLRKYQLILTYESGRKPAYVFFFRGATETGIDERTDKDMELVLKQYPDIEFLWGPRPRKNKEG